MKKYLVLLFLLAFGSGLALGQNIPGKPSPARLVNDLAGLFTASQVKQLEDSLVAFEKATSNQIVVVTVKELDGYAPGDYALEILRRWGVGKAAKNNGVVMLIKPRNQSPGEINIQVGYGLEGVLPDSKTGRIIDNEMIPALSRGDYFTAVDRGTRALMATTRGEYKGDKNSNAENSILEILPGILIALAIMIYIISRSSKNRKDGDDDNSGSGGGGSRRIPPIFWGGGFGGGSSSGGGFGGGGFGGFGGGGGGGGGAGRSF